MLQEINCAVFILCLPGLNLYWENTVLTSLLLFVVLSKPYTLSQIPGASCWDMQQQQLVQEELQLV